MINYVDAGGTIPIFTAKMLDGSNNPVTGLTVTLSIRRMDTGEYWDGTTWDVFDTVTMTETDSTNLEGLYHYNFTPTGSNYYCLVNVHSVSSAAVANKHQSSIVIVAVKFDAIDLTGIATQTDVFTRASASQVTNGFNEIKGGGWTTPADTLEGIRNAIDAISGVDVLEVEIGQNRELKTKLNRLEDLIMQTKRLAEIISKDIGLSKRR